MLSSVFVPLYGVILGRLSLGDARVTRLRKTVDIPAAAIWIAGIFVYHAIAKWAPQLGSALPTLIFSVVLAWVSRPTAQPAKQVA